MPVWGCWGHLCSYLGKGCLRMKLIQKTGQESVSTNSWYHCLSTWIQPYLKQTFSVAGSNPFLVVLSLNWVSTTCICKRAIIWKTSGTVKTLLIFEAEIFFVRQRESSKFFKPGRNLPYLASSFLSRLISRTSYLSLPFLRPPRSTHAEIAAVSSWKTLPPALCTSFTSST